MLDSNDMAANSLVESRQNYVGHLEITLNYPRTHSFMNKVSNEQKKMYRILWNSISNIFGMEKAKGYTYEFCKNGHIHLHGYIAFKEGEKYSPIGAVSDIVKSYLQKLPKKYCAYKDAYMYGDLIRYRSPSICVQYNNDIDRLVQWQKYIIKDII